MPVNNYWDKLLNGPCHYPSTSSYVNICIVRYGLTHFWAKHKHFEAPEWKYHNEMKITSCNTCLWQKFLDFVEVLA